MRNREFFEACGHDKDAMKTMSNLFLSTVPNSCPFGHEWEPSAEKGEGTLKEHFRCRFKCNKKVHKLKSVMQDGVSVDQEFVIPCNSSSGPWHKHFPLAEKCVPDNCTPSQFMEVIFGFGHGKKPQTVATDTNLDRHHVYKINDAIRQDLAESLTMNGTLLGGEGKSVVVDVTYISKRKYIRGIGPVGHQTVNQQIAILGACEIDLATNKLTGQCWLRVVDGETREAIEPIIRAIVLPGKTILTDGHMSYSWLQAAGYPHFTVIHSHGEFVDAETGVTTNSIEGLFWRVKRMLKGSGVSIPSHQNYGPYLAEFVWRQKHLRTAILPDCKENLFAFWRLTSSLSEVSIRTLPAEHDLYFYQNEDNNNILKKAQPLFKKPKRRPADPDEFFPFYFKEEFLPDEVIDSEAAKDIAQHAFGNWQPEVLREQWHNAVRRQRARPRVAPAPGPPVALGVPVAAADARPRPSQAPHLRAASVQVPGSVPTVPAQVVTGNVLRPSQAPSRSPFQVLKMYRKLIKSIFVYCLLLFSIFVCVFKLIDFLSFPFLFFILRSLH